MKKNRTLIYVIVVAVTVIAQLLWQKNRGAKETTHAAIEEVAQHEGMAATVTAEAPAEIPAATPSPEGAPQKSQSLQDKIKVTKLINAQEYREDIRKDPHTHSPRMLSSALQLGELFDAVKNEKDAAELLSYYRQCITADAPTAIKVTCYNYSKRLGTTYPALAGQVSSLDSLLDADVKKVLRRE